MNPLIGQLNPKRRRGIYGMSYKGVPQPLNALQ